MDLKTALEIGLDCELETVNEALLNIRMHAGNLFTYGEAQDEWNELIKEFASSSCGLDDKIADCLSELD